MKFSSTTTYHGSIADVTAAFISRELADARMAMLKVKDYSFDNTETQSTIDVNVPADELPDQARKLAKNGVHVTVTTTVDGTSVSYLIDSHGLPFSLQLHQKLTDKGETTSAEISGELKITVPLIGGMLEKKAANYVDSLVTKDAELVNKVLG